MQPPPCAHLIRRCVVVVCVCVCVSGGGRGADLHPEDAGADRVPKGQEGTSLPARPRLASDSFLTRF